MNSQPTWKSSRFNMWACLSDGALIVYNSYSGALVQVRDAEADYVASILAGQSLVEPKGILSVLAMEGILVPASTADELEKARNLHELLFEQNDRLHLFLMPTEKCNFRCVYCYEGFSRGKMSPEIIDSVVCLVQQQSTSLRTLSISWFGGEPLMAFDVVEEMSHRVLAICSENQIRYSASMSTNGYLLTEHRANCCLSAKISQFQVTLDGPAEIHDRLRVLAGGGTTFDTIVTNLRRMRDGAKQFHVRIRVNFTPATIPYIPEFLKFMGNEFGGDKRFSIYFRAVGPWGGESVHVVETCDRGTADSREMQFMSLALEEGLGMLGLKESMQPFGSVCYAANPRCFVIGSDGTIYKCTLAFDDPRNRIGKIKSNGKMEVDERKHRLWTLSGEETDIECQMCAFRPACQGNVCPLARLNRNEKQCPALKTHMHKYLPLLAAEATAS